MNMCPGQGFKWYEDLLFSFVFGFIFFVFGFIMGSLILLYTGEVHLYLFWFLGLPIMIYLVGSLFLFIIITIGG